MEIALFTLLHLLVFVYWLGGDLGAFYASTLLGDPSRPVDARATAAKVLADIDMAPRSALILTLPTGATLAAVGGWWAAPGWALAAIWFGALIWLALAWRVHLRHAAAGSPERRVDLGIRWLAIVGLAATGGAALAGAITLPLFLALKLLILAVAIGAGLLIRVVLAPFGSAYLTMVTSGPTAESDAVIVRALRLGRPVVVGLWSLLLAAALLGLWKPT